MPTSAAHASRLRTVVANLDMHDLATSETTAHHERGLRRTGRARAVGVDVGLGLAYLVAASSVIIFSRFDDGIALCWFATAVLVPRLALTRPAHWGRPVLFCGLASMMATAAFGAGVAAAVPFAVVVMMEACIGALLLRRFLPDGRYFDTVPRVALFVGLIGLAMPVGTAFAGAAVANLFFDHGYWQLWTDWALVHSLGTLTAMPLLSLMIHRSTRSRVREIRMGWTRFDTALGMLFLAISIAVFMQANLPLLFLPFMPLVHLTLRHGRIGASLCIVLLAAIGGVLTAFGQGPIALVDGENHTKAALFQFFLATCVLTALPLAAELNRRRFVAGRLRESEALFRLMADRSGDILFNISPDGIIRYVSPSIETIAGYAPRQLLGTTSLDLVVGEHRDRVRQAHAQSIRRPEETFVFEYRAITGNGEEIWFETHSRAMLDETGEVAGVVSAVRDVSHRKALESRLFDDANRDALTGLHNRRVFEDRLVAAVQDSAHGRPQACLVLLDIDHFKRVNDGFGHPAGDQVLREVSAGFAENLRTTDTLCRIGGEEFGFILWDIDIEDGRILCERVRAAIAARPILAGDARIHVTISMGIVPISGTLFADEVIAAADKALYRAKNGGRNRLVLGELEGCAA